VNLQMILKDLLLMEEIRESRRARHVAADRVLDVYSITLSCASHGLQGLSA
jgi:hypothetical protein